MGCTSPRVPTEEKSARVTGPPGRETVSTPRGRTRGGDFVTPAALEGSRCACATTRSAAASPARGSPSRSSPCSGHHRDDGVAPRRSRVDGAAEEPFPVADGQEVRRERDDRSPQRQDGKCGRTPLPRRTGVCFRQGRRPERPRSASVTKRTAWSPRRPSQMSMTTLVSKTTSAGIGSLRMREMIARSFTWRGRRYRARWGLLRSEAGELRSASCCESRPRGLRGPLCSQERRTRRLPYRSCRGRGRRSG